MSEVIQFRPRPAPSRGEDIARRLRVAIAAEMLLRAEGLALQAASMLPTAQMQGRSWHAANVLADIRRQAIEDMAPPPKGAA